MVKLIATLKWSLWSNKRNYVVVFTVTDDYEVQNQTTELHFKFDHHKKKLSGAVCLHQYFVLHPDHQIWKKDTQIMEGPLS